MWVVCLICSITKNVQYWFINISLISQHSCSHIANGVFMKKSLQPLLNASKYILHYCTTQSNPFSYITCQPETNKNTKIPFQCSNHTINSIQNPTKSDSTVICWQVSTYICFWGSHACVGHHIASATDMFDLMTHSLRNRRGLSVLWAELNLIVARTEFFQNR